MRKFFCGVVVSGIWQYEKNIFKFFIENRFVVSIKPEDKSQFMHKYANPNWIEDMYLKPNPVSIIELGTFILSLCILVIYLFII